MKDSFFLVVNKSLLPEGTRWDRDDSPLKVEALRTL